MTVRIQRAHVREVMRVKPLWQLIVQRYQEVAGDDWPVRDPQEAWQERHQEYLTWINEAAGVLFVAWVDDDDAEPQAVGYAALHFVEADATIHLGDRFGIIEALAVLPDYRDQGIGLGLIAACRSELDRREISYCAIETLSSNDAGLKLCEKGGFRPYMVRLVQRIGGD